MLEPNDPSHDQTPIVHSYTYNLDPNAHTFDGGILNGNLFFPLENCFQSSLCYEFSREITSATGPATFGGDLETSGTLFLDHGNISSVTYAATNSITLTPGFHVKSGNRGSFTATISDPNPNLNALTVNEYFAGCNQFPNGRVESTNVPEEVETVDIPEALTLTLFPNPATHRLDLFIGNGLPESQVTIIDMYGRIVEQVKVPGYSYVIDLSNYTAGLYVINLRNGEQVITKKFVKQ